MSDNPFLLPPGGAKPSASPPAASPPAASPTSPAAPSGDPSHYIAVPASVESATHRIARPPQQDVPAAAPVTEETRVAPVRDASAPMRDAEACVLVLPDGARVPLHGALLIGRDPAGIPARPDARLLAVIDPGKTVSKTHALLEPSAAADGVQVHDLYSTNGVAVDTAEGRTLVTPGGQAHASVGSSILLGSFVIEVAIAGPDHA